VPRRAPAISTASAEPDPTAQRSAPSGFKPMDWLARPSPRDSVASTSCRLLQRCDAVRALAQHHAIAATTQQLVERGLRSFLVHAELSGSRSTPTRRTAPSFAGRRASARRALRRSSVERRRPLRPVVRPEGHWGANLARRGPRTSGTRRSSGPCPRRRRLRTHVVSWREHRPAALRRPAGASSDELDIFLW
jgi:hypothetical protein